MSRSPWTHDRIMAALVPVDAAFSTSERTWGVGRLETLVTADTLARWRKGWQQWRAALEDSDADAVEALAPKMTAALRYMEAEATRLGHEPLSAVTWEALMPDGRVLVVVRTQAEAHRVAQAAKLGPDAEIPPDLVAAVRHQQAGRELVVWTMSELALVLPNAELLQCIKNAWPGARVQPVTTLRDGDAADYGRADPIRAVIEGVG